MMKQAEQTKTFEQILLSHAEMCYAVARTLTRNPEDARDLTRDVLIWAWHLRDRADAATDIKRKLLIALRRRYLQDYCQTAHSLRNHAALPQHFILSPALQ